jgi:O-antigen ligase
LLFSEAATSLISLLFVICLLKALEFLSLKSKVKLHLVVISIAVSILLSIVLIVNINSFLNASGKDVTLTGRTILWDSLGDYIKLKPMFGYGYGSFFSSAHQETQSLWEKFSWEPVHAHNGYIQILLFIGIAGFTIFLFGYLVYIIKTLHSYLLYRDTKLLWATSLLTYTILFNFTEISFLTSNNLTWVLSISSLYSIRLAKKTRLYVYKNNPIYLH